MSNIPSDAPPSYDSVAGGSSSHQTAGVSGHLGVPGQNKSKNGIPSAHRRSMEDECRPLPKGWVRSFDPETGHQFFVDTTTEPPRSIWTHPYDDEGYLRTLSGEERERIEQESLRHPGGQPSKADIMHEHTDEEDHATPSELPPRPAAKDASGKGKGKAPLGRRMKDKLTGTTHEERERERARRDEEERQLYERHLKIRQAMAKAMQTGQPQLIGKDRDGKDVYIEPPGYQQGYAGGGGLGAARLGGGGYGGGGMYPGRQMYSPYGSGMYAPPGSYMRPAMPYGRPYGGGFGGGYGMPLALGGGLLGGALLGGALF